MQDAKFMNKTSLFFDDLKVNFSILLTNVVHTLCI